MIGDSLERKGLSKLRLAVGGFLFHTTAAMIVSPIVVVITVLVFQNLPSHLKSVAETGGVANPIFWSPGFVFGLLLNYVTRHRSACWVWLCGVAWLAAGILDSIRYYDRRFYQGCSSFENVVNAFFVLNSRRCGGGGSTLAGFFFTMPALNSVAYAVGAWVAISYMGRFDSTDANQKTTTLGLN